MKNCPICKYYQEQGTLCQLTNNSVLEIEECEGFEQDDTRANAKEHEDMIQSMSHAASKMIDEGKKGAELVDALREKGLTDDEIDQVLKDLNTRNTIKLCLWTIGCIVAAAVCYYFDRLGYAITFGILSLQGIWGLWKYR